MPKKVLFSESVISHIISESLLEASATEIHGKYYQDIPEQDYRQIIFTDPTSNRQKDKMGKYGKWILSLYKQGKLKTGDIPELKDSLTYFDKFKGKLEKKDINQYHSVPELFNSVKQFMDNPNQATSKSDELRKMKQEGAEKVYEDEEWLVIVPKTEQAACLYGKGTKWCTAATDGGNMFEYYNNSGPLYININKKTGRKYQFHFQTEQFMDEQDNPIGRNIPEKIGMTQGLYDFYGSDPERFPLAKLIFRFNKYGFIEDTEGDGTIIFFTYEDGEDTEYGWLDYNTQDSLTGNELFSKCYPFKDNVAPYRDKQNRINVMGWDGKPLLKKSLPGEGVMFSAFYQQGKVFQVFKMEQKEYVFNLVSVDGKFLFNDWLDYIMKLDNEFLCRAVVDGKGYECIIGIEGNVVQEWKPIPYLWP